MIGIFLSSETLNYLRGSYMNVGFYLGSEKKMYTCRKHHIHYVCARYLVQTFLSNGPSSLVSPSEAY